MPMAWYWVETGFYLRFGNVEIEEAFIFAFGVCVSPAQNLKRVILS